MRLGKIWRLLSPIVLGFTLGLSLAPLWGWWSRAEVEEGAEPEGGGTGPLTAASAEREAVGIQRSERWLAARLRSSVRLLCWVMHEGRRAEAREAILRTWGPRCGLLLFVTGRPLAEEHLPAGQRNRSSPRPGLNTTTPRHGERLGPNAVFVVLPLTDHYRALWAKTRMAFEFVAKHYGRRYDWFFKVDDDAYVVVENLLLLLLALPRDRDEYYGCPYKAIGGYNSGGPGYVMSQRVLGKLAAVLGSRSAHCAPAAISVAEDVELAKCLRAAGVTRGDTRDGRGRFRFSPFDPSRTMHHHLLSKGVRWFFAFSEHPLRNGPDCCSDTAISYHYVKPDLMITMDYLVYGLHPFSARDVWAPERAQPSSPTR